MASNTPAYDKLKRTNKRYAQFVSAYVELGSGAAAAKAAGFKGKPQSIRARAVALLKLPEISTAISELTGTLLDRAELSVERVLEEIRHNALVDPGELFDENGQLRKVNELPEHVRRAIAGIDVTVRPDGTVAHKIKLNSKTEALTLAGRYFKMFTDNMHISGTLTHEQALDQLDDDKT